MADPGRELANAATWTLGALRTDAARAVLDGPRPEPVAELVWTAAQARQGNDDALEELFAERDINALVYALPLASESRRARFFDDLLDLPTDEALATIRELGDWPVIDVHLSVCDPAYDDACFEGLEARVAGRVDLDPRVVAACIAALPCCETTRLADRLLSHSPGDLFLEPAEDEFLDVRYETNRHLGHRGVWPFLEVTRPERFRAWLREGASLDAPAVRNRCCQLLVALGEHEPLAQLVAWLDDPETRNDAGEEAGWLRLAESRTPAVVELLRERARAGAEEAEEVMRPLAVASGMPMELAENWWVADPSARSAAVDALLRGDAAAAYLLGRKAEAEPSADADLAFWDDPRIRQHLEHLRHAVPISGCEALSIDLALALAAADRDAIARWMGPVRDGRYATHHGVSARLAARAIGIDELAFWIDQLGTNCCKCAFIDGVLEQLFGCESQAFHWSGRCREPAAVYLRRTLLPVADRLRWSRIVRAYVVAGR